jgi:hypothetical protein
VRFFTPDEANAALRTVRPLAERLVRLRAVFVEAERGLNEARAESQGNGHGAQAARAAAFRVTLEETAASIRDVLVELDDHGVQVKDPDSGLVDFPARHPDGSVVLLCWQVGEPSVAAWHTLDGGFAGRKPLPF